MARRAALLATIGVTTLLIVTSADAADVLPGQPLDADHADIFTQQHRDNLYWWNGTWTPQSVPACVTASSITDHTRQLRVLLVDDDPMVRTGLAMILDSANDITVVGHADDGDQAITMVTKHAPDVVLMDIRMARMDGLAATAAVCALPNAPRVLVLTSFNLDEYVFDALTAGASGFLLKEESPQDIIDGVRIVASGEAMLSPRTTRTLISHFVAERRNPHRHRALARLTSLTDREREVATAIAQGKQNSAITKELYMSEATVKTHIARTFAKLGVSNRVQLAILAYQAGLLAS